ncbi:MAG: hypothetical protein LC131_06540 [Anaerolineae bacterium]|nr:hypothetical protein [Anaerolineae bacterium]
MATVLAHNNKGSPKIWVLMSDGVVIFGSLTQTGGLQSRLKTSATPLEKIRDGYTNIGTFPDSVVLDFTKGRVSVQAANEMKKLCDRLDANIGSTARVSRVRQGLPAHLQPFGAAASPATPAPGPKPKKKPSPLKNWKKPSSDEPYAW